ncbi:hypothetical protein CCR75_006486 [Bremia lactucae]|uniref:Uncharacterized protein n=1 Tax=Bremia lactucae TaxID=4779 RepID=A0A976FSP3_BRELC|nr:hypothetical protein CCR75_006486 [Bremia lactucae]
MTDKRDICPEDVFGTSSEINYSKPVTRYDLTFFGETTHLNIKEGASHCERSERKRAGKRNSQKLVFVDQVPSYVYQNVTFQATVMLTDSTNVKVTGLQKPLQVLLRYNDSYDVVEDQDAFLRLNAAATIDADSGMALLSMCVRTLTATCDGRNFCLEVRSIDGEIEPIFSSSVHLVKEKLHVVTQPPDVWYKDEGGREKCMTIALTLVPAPGTVVEDRVVPLDVKLLYESGNLVLNQNILRFFPDMRPNMTHGRALISFRIDDVSKNHQGQSFRLDIGPEQQDGSFMFKDIAPTRTSVIAIRSKRNKRKLHAGGYTIRASPRSVVGTPRTPFVPPPGSTEMMEPPLCKYGEPPTSSTYPNILPMGSMSWSSHVVQPPHPSLTVATPLRHPASTPSPVSTATGGAVEWILNGFEIHPHGSMNASRPIYRCPHCRRLNDVDMLATGPLFSHNPHCVFYPTQHPAMFRTPFDTSSLPDVPLRRYSTTYSPVVDPSTDISLSYPLTTTHESDAGVFHNQQNTVHIISKPDEMSSTTLASLIASHRSSVSSSIHMSKDKVENGNLFESHGFQDSLERIEKGAIHSRALVEDDPALELPVPSLLVNSHSDDEKTTAFHGVVPLFQDMSSKMNGRDLDTLDNGTDGEDEVYYILARMYTSAQDHKLGLPAFDQFQRMLGFYSENQDALQTRVLFHPLIESGLTDEEQGHITSQFVDELRQDSLAVHSLPKYQHNLIMLREDALMFYWSQSLVVRSPYLQSVDYDTTVKVRTALERESKGLNVWQRTGKRLQVIRIDRVNVNSCHFP